MSGCWEIWTKFLLCVYALLTFGFVFMGGDGERTKQFLQLIIGRSGGGFSMPHLLGAENRC